MKCVVVLIRKDGHLHDKSWDAQTEMQASMMVRWLRDNHIEAVAYSNADWEKLPHYNEE
jgi:hypothetical protein